MKSMMKKTTLREIKQSLGRYCAILAIVALGVSLFSGLKVTNDIMVTSAGGYLKELQFYDYHLLSTLGFEEEDVNALAAKEDVRAVEGAVSADIIFINEENNESVIKAHSLTKQLNGLMLTAGRLPESADECVVDSNLYGEEAIGSKIVLSKNNEKEDLDHFTYGEYTIVGIVQSSLYIQFERGNTSLGNGRVSGFMYLLPEGFQMDLFTEIYVKFAEDMEIYSEEYDAYLEEKEPVWEAYCEEQGNRRYQSIVDEAEAEIADAQKELDEKRIDAEAELSDAKDKLLKAGSELADGEEKLAEGEKELSDAQTALAEKENELAAAREDFTVKQAYLPVEMASAMEAQLQAGEAEIAKAKEELKTAQSELSDKKEELLEAKDSLSAGWSEYNESLAEFEKEIEDAENEISDARADVAEIEKPDTYVLGRNTNIGYACFESDSGIVEGIANVFPVFFFLVAALVCMTTMNRMVEEQRTQIGVLKALGYGEGTIMGKFLFYSGSAAIIGCIVGYFVGIHIFPWVIWTAYGMMYRLGDIIFVYDWSLLAFCLVCSIACSMGTTWVSCRHELKEVAAGLMRPKAPKAGKRVFLERIPFIWKRLKFLQKVSVRNIVRYKKRFFMMVMGISGCTALLVTGFGVKDSVTDIANQQFQRIQVYDLGVTLKEGIHDADYTELKHTITDAGGTYTSAYENTIDLVVDDTVKPVSLVVAENPSELAEYIDLHTEKGASLVYPQKGEVILSNKLAERLNIEIGDIVTLKNDAQQTVLVRVTGICENYIYNYAYLNAETLAQTMGQPSYKNLYVNLPETADLHEVSASIMKLDKVTAVSVNADTMVRFSSMMGSMNYIVLVIIGCAAALAFIVLYNLNNINITERIREIATIKVLGFYKKETAAYVFRENMVLTAIGCGVGLLLGRLLHLYVMHEIDIDMVSFDVKISALGYLYSVLLTFFFNFIVNRMMSGKLDRINMAESLKSVD